MDNTEEAYQDAYRKRQLNGEPEEQERSPEEANRTASNDSSFDDDLPFGYDMRNSKDPDEEDLDLI